jgi:tetratricopeptide (TPR) repeat protein
MKNNKRTIKTILASTYFTCILLIFSNGVLAQGGGFSVESDDGAIVLSDVNAEININGPFAETTLELGFENTSSNLLQGTFKINLPGGVIISDLSLMINGQWEDGELIEKHSARKQYEAVVRRKVDPAVLSWINGSIYQVRIYPFPANDKRWIKIKYWQDLSNSSSDWQYLLPLAKNQKLDTFKMRLTVDAPALESVMLSKDYQQVAYLKAIANNNHRFEALAVEDDFTIPGDFTLDISHSNDRRNAWVAKHTPEGEYPYFAVHWLEDLEPIKRQPSNKLLIYIDTSLSMNDTNVDDLNSFIGDLIHKSAASTQVVIKSFNHAVHDIIAAKAKNLSDYQIMPVFDGASNYQAVLQDIANNNKGSDVVIITDAQVSMQTEQALKHFENLGVSLFFLPANNTFSQYWSSALASANNGKILPILGTDFATIWGEFSKASWQILSYEIDQGNVNEVFPQTGAKISSKGVKVAFRSINSKPGSIALKLKAGDQIRVLSANLNTAIISSSAEKLWAYRKLFELVGSSRDLSKEILLHAKRYQIVSPQTSYIVMEPGVPLMTSESESRSARLSAEEHRDSAEAGDLMDESNSEMELAVRVIAHQEVASLAYMARMDDSWGESGSAITGAASLTIVGTNGGTSSSATLDLLPQEVADASSSYIESRAVSGDVSVIDTDWRILNSKDIEVCQNHTPMKSHSYGRLGIRYDDHSVKKPPIYFIKRDWDSARLNKEYFNNRDCHLNEAWFFIEYAQRFFEFKQKGRALSVLSNLFEIQQEDGNSLRALGLSSSLFAQHEWGEMAFNLLTQLRPEEVQNYRDLAWLYVEQGKYQRALDVFQDMSNVEWHGRFPALRALILKEAGVIKALMSKHGHQPALYSYITWNTDNTDVDFWIDEGHSIYYVNYRHSHKSIGALSRDFTSGYGPEVYFTSDSRVKSLKFYAHYFNGDNTVQSKSVVGKFSSITFNQGKPIINTVVFPLFNRGDRVRVQ